MSTHNNISIEYDVVDSDHGSDGLQSARVPIHKLQISGFGERVRLVSYARKRTLCAGRSDRAVYPRARRNACRGTLLFILIIVII